MRVLHLTLKKQWFDLIDARIKKEEYREISPYWAKRFLVDVSYHKSIDEPTPEQLCDYIKTGSNLIAYDVQESDVVQFYNGWACSTKYRNFQIQCKGIEIGEGNPAWGAEPGKKYFVIKLGEKVKSV
jgi:hypothetical protein